MILCSLLPSKIRAELLFYHGLSFNIFRAHLFRFASFLLLSFFLCMCVCVCMLTCVFCVIQSRGHHALCAAKRSMTLPDRDGDQIIRVAIWGKKVKNQWEKSLNIIPMGIWRGSECLGKANHRNHSNLFLLQISLHTSIPSFVENHFSKAVGKLLCLFLLFSKRPDGKYFKLCGLQSLCQLLTSAIAA